MTIDKTEIWVFGYGSLMWNPGFAFDECQIASVEGFERLFWQASHDHRGTEEQPGRVVTLVPVAGSVCTGLAFKVTDKIDITLNKLDHREKDGYQRKDLSICSQQTGQQFPATTWIASTDHSSWRGGEAMSQTAKVIANAKGPSGSNWEYLQQLDQSLKKMHIHDEYVSKLLELVTSQRALSQKS